MGEAKSTKATSAAAPPSNDTRSEPARSAATRAKAEDIGLALRAAYDNAVNEDIPPEMLDLLDKLC